MLLSAALLTSLVSSPSLAPNDWPQWRGPARDGVSTETEWTVAGKESWRTQVGLGYSTVSVVGGHVYTTGWLEEQGQDVVWCLDAESGEKVWSHSYRAKKWDQYHGGGTLTTPSVRDEAVFVMNREGRFVCLDAATGKMLWGKQLDKLFGFELPTWGLSASPLLLDDEIVLNVGPVLGLDYSGQLIWRTERDYTHAYSTPVDCTLLGKPCLAVMGGQGFAVIERGTGKELAFHEWKTKYDVNAATPVPVGDDRIWISSGYDHGGALLKLTADGLEVVWETKAMRNQMATSVLIGEHLYGLDEAQLKCFDLDGKELWRERGIGKGALSAAGDRLILMSSKGELVIVKASPNGYEELSREKVLDGGVCWSMPVLANGSIYCRNSLGELVCRSHVKAKEAGGQ